MKEKVRLKKKKANSVPLHYSWKIGSRQTHRKNWPLRTSVEDKEIGSESLTEILPASCNPSIQIQCV